jgi:hypothetical protein
MGKDTLTFEFHNSKKSKNILLVSAYGNLEEENSRFTKMYNTLCAAHKVHTITSDFDHWAGRYKTPSANPLCEHIHVPSYKRHLSLRRLASLLVFAVRLRARLKTITPRPDVLYALTPSSSSAYVCGCYCKRYGVKLIIDVVEPWPASLYVLKRFGSLLKVLLYPWQLLTNKGYRQADVINAVSKGYMELAKRQNPGAPSLYIYLGLNPGVVAQLVAQSSVTLSKPPHEIWICYGGNLGHSYDFEAIIRALDMLQAHRIAYRFFFVGGGDREQELRQMIADRGLNAIVTGFLPYGNYLKYLAACDIGVNIFKANTHIVHSYKFNDYVAANLFVLNSLTGETAETIAAYRMGLNFNFTDQPIEQVLYDVCSRWSSYKAWRKNNARLITDLLDERITYKKIYEYI